MLRITGIKLSLSATEEVVKQKVCSLLRVKTLRSFSIVKRALDARDKTNLFYVYTVECDPGASYAKAKNVTPIAPYHYPLPHCSKPPKERPIVVGSGPCGLFCALFLAYAGLRPIVIERGAPVEERTKDVQAFWSSRRLNTESNVQFGEGGAGTFSDGKLNSNIKNLRCRKVLEEFVACGAPGEILYHAKPHIGTDILKTVVATMRKRIIELGGTYHFHCKFTDLIMENGVLTGIETTQGPMACSALFLAIGHSARDTFEMLESRKMEMCQKPFAVGLRIEHLQEHISKTQYGKFYTRLGAADYKLAAHTKDGSLYTFCMCPGGYVVASASEEGGVVTNGMSEFARDGKNANSALLVNVDEKDFQSSAPLAGMYFQRKLEQTAYRLGGENYNAPVQLTEDFLQGKLSGGVKEVLPTYRPGTAFANLAECFNGHINSVMREGLLQMDRQLPGFAESGSILTGVESRSSSPVKLVRDETFQSNLRGIYPCGEGAGYAGGILSAAVDGIRCAESYIEMLNA